MRTTQINQQFPAGFPGMITNRNLALQTQPAISLEIHYVSQVMYYDNEIAPKLKSLFDKADVVIGISYASILYPITTSALSKRLFNFGAISLNV